MKPMHRIKKFFASIGLGIGALTTKAFGMATFYGPPPVALYGVEQPESLISITSKLGAIVVVPIVLIIGAIVYIKKRKK